MRTLRNIRLVAVVLACGLLSAARAPVALGDPSATWVGYVSVEGLTPIPVSLHLNMVAPPFVSGTVALRPIEQVGCPSCLPCPPWAGIVTGKFDDGAYSLTVSLPTKNLLDCTTTCTSTIDLLLDFEADGSLHGFGYYHECFPGLQDFVTKWRMAPLPP